MHVGMGKKKKNHRQSLRPHFSQPWGRKNKNKVGGKERAGVCEWESFASEEVGEGGEIAYKGDQVRQEIFHEILKRRCLRLLLREDVRWIPLTFSSALSSLCRDVCESRRSTCKETVDVPLS